MTFFGGSRPRRRDNLTPGREEGTERGELFSFLKLDPEGWGHQRKVRLGTETILEEEHRFGYSSTIDMDRTRNPLNPELEVSDTYWALRWRDYEREIRLLASPILQSGAFRRLGGITFLGILSPRFAGLVSSPLYRPRQGGRRAHAPDGSRQSHSVGVAAVALAMVRSLGFSSDAQRYAVAWGLLHDISNWPLSHTGEYAFQRLTNVDADTLRSLMILGDSEIPQEFRMDKALREMRIDPEELNALYEFKPTSKLQELSDLTKCPLNPDVVEGMFRSGEVFGVEVERLWDIPHFFVRERRLHGESSISVSAERSRHMLKFWRQKGTIYRDYINRPSVILWESRWSEAIRIYFEGMTLCDSLRLTEDDVMRRVREYGLPVVDGVRRWKEPQEYLVNRSRIARLREHMPVDSLGEVLRRRSLGMAQRKSEKEVVDV